MKKTTLFILLNILLFGTLKAQIKHSTNDGVVNLKTLVNILEKIPLNNFDVYFLKIGYKFNGSLSDKESGLLVSSITYKNTKGIIISCSFKGDSKVSVIYQTNSQEKFLQFIHEAEIAKYQNDGTYIKQGYTVTKFDSQNITLEFQKSSNSKGSAYYSIYLEDKENSIKSND